MDIIYKEESYQIMGVCFEDCSLASIFWQFMYFVGRCYA